MSEDIKNIGKDMGPMISSLSQLTERAASIDVLAVRRFLQEERIEELEQ